MKKNWLLILPLALFLGLAGLFTARLVYHRVTGHPSALRGKPAPTTVFQGFDGGKNFKTSDFMGEVVVLNFFAAWCPPCREEHPQLVTLSKQAGFKLVGINFKDKLVNAKQFLVENGNPYALIGVDEKGRNALDWGVYGIPETFVVNAKGIVTFKYIGPISPQILQEKIMPEIKKAVDENK